MTRLGLLLLLSAGAACGPTYIVLEVDVDGTLEIPIDADLLVVTSTPRDDPATLLADAEYPLDPDWSFPIRVLLEPGDETPPWIRHAVVAQLGDTPRAAADVVHNWESHADTIVPIELVVIHGGP